MLLAWHVSDKERIRNKNCWFLLEPHSQFHSLSKDSNNSFFVSVQICTVYALTYIFMQFVSKSKFDCAYYALVPYHWHVGMRRYVEKWLPGLKYVRWKKRMETPFSNIQWKMATEDGTIAPLWSKHLHPQSNSANGESPHLHINYPTGSQRSATLSTEDRTIGRRFDSCVEQLIALL